MGQLPLRVTKRAKQPAQIAKITGMHGKGKGKNKVGDKKQVCQHASSMLFMRD
jgi:hypothetical protein